MSEIATELLSQAGLNFRRQSRGLFARVSGLPVDLVFLRTDDIPTLWTLTGGAIVVLAGLYLLARERRAQKEGPAALVDPQ